MSIKTYGLGLLAVLLFLPALSARATCHDTVVLVHGNTGSPADFQNTYDRLRQQGWSDAQIVAPAWGNAYCAACNDHSGSEETPVRNAISSAISTSKAMRYARCPSPASDGRKKGTSAPGGYSTEKSRYGTEPCFIASPYIV